MSLTTEIGRISARLRSWRASNGNGFEYQSSLQTSAGFWDVRFRRWAEQGVWDALLETLVDLGLTDDWQLQHR